MPYHSDATGWELDRAEHYASREPVYDRPMAAHLADPLDEHDSSPGLVHAWEQHHVLSWLYAVGLSDVVANFKAQKLRGEDLLQLTPKNVAQKLSLTDVCEAARYRGLTTDADAISAQSASSAC